MRRLGLLRGGFAGQPSNSWNQLPFDPVLNPLGAGFAGQPANYWSQLSTQPVQYVMAPGFPSQKLVPKTTLSGWRGGRRMRGLRGLGACTGPDMFLSEDGCCYDTDGNRLTCPGGIAPSPAGVNRLDLPQAPTITAGSASQNTIVPSTPPPPPSPSQPGAWDQFVAWLGQSTIPGVKNGYLLTGVAMMAAFGARRGRR